MGNRVSDHSDEEEMAAVHWEFEVDQDDPEVDVAEVIAELEDCDSTKLSPAYETIDHIIEKLFADPLSAEAQAVLQFSYEGYRITLKQDGHATFMKVAQGE